MKIINNGDYIGTDEGRLYLNGYTLEWKCSECGEENSLVLNRDSYMYDCIKINEYKNQKLYCINCDNEQEIKFKINLNIEVEER